MIAYRLAAETYKDDLSGNGAKLFGGRWNSVGLPVIYTTENISLAVLEILVRADPYTIPLTYHLINIEIPDSIQPLIITSAKLKAIWKDDIGYTQWMGDEFVKSNNGLLLKVPSAVVDQENNFILNPRHADLKKVKIVAVKKFMFDKRLFLKDE
ncbi:RES family NAD+ phosphorylase [Ferruginibacter paludis]|uniref:RES family NAD+ phosphorylase n=1 Tax=Ferruginibacter paludis TaxID=1310417 RepID=UPI0025B48F50|nr:RES family NAD+ phosphorylase [Ferruginibacter paludis]MDN3654688.1 RES family NAD+ phosphorylase [Ferruginibacter paludis]